MRMLGGRLQVLLAALVSSGMLVKISAAPNRDLLMEVPRADLVPDEALTRFLVLKFLSELLAAGENEVLPELEEEEEEEEKEEVVQRHLPPSQRDRKAGCRNFFWKTFTSC
ncbi:somatostatin-1A [Lampris incognitus]|uniref:somatostatin-1A n=1 Tax=Lampris incognitus TaxID=2546036 RepID=UPI0024B4BDAD|nr:somatostatin-1A [Lampris incognitus]